MKNKKLLTLGLSLCTVSAIAALAAVGGGRTIFRHTNALADEVWSHYLAVNPTFDTNGSKEYWISCSTHEVRFTAPSDVTIEDKGAPSQAFVDGLADDDARLIKAYSRVYAFEDGVVPTFFTSNSVVASASIGATSGVEGSKCLEVSVKAGDFEFGFDKNYLDAAFANSWVKAVAFDAKATAASQNWRTGATGGEVGSKQPFEGYHTDSGITTSWKTFYFTRAMYENWSAQMIRGSTGAGTVYIDNVRPVDYDIYSNCGRFGFESNGFKGSSFAEGSTEISVRFGNNVQGLSISGAGVVNSSWSYDYNIKSEGNRSIKYTKQSGYTALYLNKSIINAIPGDYVLIDMYSTTGINSYDNNKGICTGMNGAFNKQTPGNKWFTIVLNKTNDITSDGRTLQIQGGAAGDIYFDNIRGASKLDEVETGYAFKAGQYGYYLDYKTDTTETAGNTIRDVNKNYTFMVNGANLVSAEVTSEKVSSHSNRSVKFTYSGKGYCALLINPNLLNDYLPKGYTISFDLYVNGSFTGGTAWGNIANKCMGKWGTVTLTEDMFEKNSSNVYNGRFFANNFNEAG
ncbi:MAG: hypothetical protein MJ248_05340, partial [Bacilli bacterium]|nr:hypothetical protein [Bacilli bacterium]